VGLAVIPIPLGKADLEGAIGVGRVWMRASAVAEGDPGGELRVVRLGEME
jgi:hypothetical protein